MSFKSCSSLASLRLLTLLLVSIVCFMLLVYYSLTLPVVRSGPQPRFDDDFLRRFLRTYDALQILANVTTSITASVKRDQDGCEAASLWQQRWHRNNRYDWQPTDSSNDTFVFSAHVDARNFADNVVVVIGMSRRYLVRSIAFVDHYCYVYEREGGGPSLFPATFKYVPETHNTEYAISIHECVLTGLGKNRPYGVSLARERCQKPVNWLLLDEPSPGITFNFTVCYGPMHSNYDDYKQLVETTELNRMFGAQHFYFYDQFTHPAIAPYIDKYVSEGLATRIPWNPPVESGVHYHAQVAAINDCLFRNLDRSRFLVISDLDEVIVPRRDNTWLQLLARVSHNYYPLFPGVYSVRNSFFVHGIFNATPSDFDWLSYCPSGVDKIVCGAIIDGLRINSLRRVRRDSRIWPWNDRSKVIVWTKAVKMMGIHQLFDALDRSRVGVVQVDSDDALLHHYRTEIDNNKDIVPDAHLAQTRWLQIYDRVRRRHEIVLRSMYGWMDNKRPRT